MAETISLNAESANLDEARFREEQKLRLDFLNALHVAFKGARYFPPQNESVIKKTEQLLALIGRIVRSEGQCSIEHVHDFLLINGSRVKTDVASLVAYNSILETLSKLKTGIITFDAAATFEDLRGFLCVFAKLDPRDSSKNTFEAIEKAVRRQGRTGITIGPQDAASQSSREDDLRKRSVETYFRSISLARSILQSAHAGQVVGFRRAKRAAQSVIDIAMDDDFFLLSLGAVKNYDDYIYNHSTNVCIFSVTFANYLGFSRERLRTLGMSALLHDIGKQDVGPEILNKPGRLTRDEWERLKNHPMFGVKRLLKPAEMNENLIRSIIVTFQHHKCVDMTGYPEIASPRDLNFLSKIVAIADVYDALTTPRVYRARSYSTAEALAIMLDDAGTVFDTVLLNKFAAFVSLYPIGTIVTLDTGETGLVCRVRHEIDMLDRPVIKLLTDKDGKPAEPILMDLSDTNPDGGYLRNIVSFTTPGNYFTNLEDYFKLM